MHYFDLQFISILIVQYWLAYNTRCHNTKTIQINFVHIKLSFYTLIKYNINIFVFIFIIVFTKNKINVNFVKLVFIIFLRFFVIGFNRLFFFFKNILRLYWSHLCSFKTLSRNVVNTFTRNTWIRCETN